MTGLQDLERAANPGQATRGQSIEIGTTNAYGRGAQCKRLQDVGATAYAAIDHDFHFMPDPINDGLATSMGAGE